MDSSLAKSALLNTSAATDVLRSGGEVSITDLLAFDIDNLLAAGQKVYRAEVSQVVGINVNSVVKTANTKYSIIIGNVLNEYEGGHKSLQTYSWTSGTATPTNATIIAGLVAAVNNSSINNYVTAADASPTINITDDAGYYPIRPAGRAGPSTVLIGDSNTTMAGAVRTVSTAGVIGYGVGAYILSNVPVKDPMTGNLISGELDTPAGAVSGQNYDGFHMTYTKEVNHQAVSGLRAEKVLRQLIYVDNGTGTSTANLAGYQAFLREFDRLIYHNYTKDSNSQISFLDFAPSFTGTGNTGLPATADGSVNPVVFSDATIDKTNIGIQTIVAPLWSSSGLAVLQDVTGTNGTEYSASIQGNSPVEYVVGKDACSFKALYTASDITHLNPFAHGFRTKIAHNADPVAYADVATLNIDDAAGVTKAIRVKSRLASGGVTTAASGQVWTDDLHILLEVQVDSNGVVKYLINNTDVSSAIATFTFADGAVLIPFMSWAPQGANNAGLEIKRWLSTAGTFSY